MIANVILIIQLILNDIRFVTSGRKDEMTIYHLRDEDRKEITI